MNVSRKYILFVQAAVCCVLPLQSGYGQSVAKIDPFAVQAQTYAVLDISGREVSQIAFDDSNNAAFAYFDGDTHKVARWRNGAIEAGSPKATASKLRTRSFEDPNQEVLAPAATMKLLSYYLNASGDVGMTCAISDWTDLSPNPLSWPATATWTYGQEQATNGWGIGDTALASHFSDFENGVAILDDGTLLGGGPLYYPPDYIASQLVGFGKVNRGDNVPSLLSFFGDLPPPTDNYYSYTLIGPVSPAGNIGVWHAGSGSNSVDVCISDLAGNLTDLDEHSAVMTINDSKDATIVGEDGTYLIENGNISTKKYFLSTGSSSGLGSGY